MDDVWLIRLRTTAAYQLAFAENVSDGEIVVQLLVVGGILVRQLDEFVPSPRPR